MEDFLNVLIAQGKAVVQPNRMLDHQKVVALGVDVGHSGLASPDPVKATQQVEPVLHVTGSQSKMMVEPNGVLNNGHREPVVGLAPVTNGQPNQPHQGNTTAGRST